ncbi:MAG: manganese-dependent inorganic pyrophosphatase [Albidovulum sp.]|nr:manganese-dependent inorganic pyrophosphatase [Albidovulum sp.]
MIKVFGHKAPDTDSAGSAIIWAWYLSEILDRTAEPRLLGAPSKEARYVLDRWGFEVPEILSEVGAGDQVVLVDTNNVAELPDNIGDANIVEIIDHHLLQGGLKTKSPINITVRPLACTATVMNQLMGSDADKLSPGIKGIMLSCIISDTLEFRSPTTTPTDRELAEKLARELDVEISELAKAMFKAKSDISEYSDEQLLEIDSKKYEIEGKSFRISVLETMNPSAVLNRKRGLMAAIDSRRSKEGIDVVLFFVVNILEQNAVLLLPNEFASHIAERSFGALPTGDTVELPGIVSRKKQIIPNLTW